MAPNPRIYNMPPEILDLIFKELSNDELLSFPTDLVAKGLRASTAEARFQYLHFGINKDSLERLWRLSKYPGAAGVVKALVIHTLRTQELDLDDFLKLQWERHLKDYRKRCPLPNCVTINDVHEAVGVKNWRSCKTCAGLTPRQQLNRFTRFKKANDDHSGAAEAVLVYAFRHLLANDITAIRIEEHDYLDKIVAYKAVRKEKIPKRTDRPTINIEHLPPTVLNALGRSRLQITLKSSHASGMSLTTSRLRALPSGLSGAFAWNQMNVPTPSSDYRAPFTLVGMSVAQKLFSSEAPVNTVGSFDLTHVFTFAHHGPTKRPAEEDPPGQAPVKAARGPDYPRTERDATEGMASGDVAGDPTSEFREFAERTKSIISRLRRGI